MADKIWVADDDLFYRKLISEVLTSYGYDVMAMHDGTHLLGVLEEESPELIVLDVFMARKSGIELLEEMNRLFETRGEDRIPVIMITGDDSRETEIAARQAKADFFLLKPFSGQELYEVVYRMIKEKKRRRCLKEKKGLKSD